MVKQKEQEVIQPEHLFHQMVAKRAENKIEGQIAEVTKTNNHFNVFKGHIQKCWTVGEWHFLSGCAASRDVQAFAKSEGSSS